MTVPSMGAAWFRLPVQRFPRSNEPPPCTEPQTLKLLVEPFFVALEQFEDAGTVSGWSHWGEWGVGFHIGRVAMLTQLGQMDYKSFLRKENNPLNTHYFIFVTILLFMLFSFKFITAS